MQKERLEKDKMVVARGDVSLAEKRVALRPQTIFASSRDRVAWTMRLESSGVQGHSGKLSTSTFQGYMGSGSTSKAMGMTVDVSPTGKTRQKQNRALYIHI